MLRGPATDTQITHRQRLWLYVLVGLIALFLVLPALIVIPMSFSDSRFLQFPPKDFSWRWYETYLNSVEWQDATAVSIKVSALTVLLATPIGTLAAYGLHVSQSRLAGLIRLALITPLIIPLILIAIAVFFLYARLGLNNTILGLALAHTCLAIPFVLVTVTAGLRSYDINQEMVARSLGASRAVAFLTVTLPQIRFSVISGALLAFIASFDEVVIALFIAGGEAAPLTRRMFNALRDEIDPTVAAISSLLIVLAVVLMTVSQWVEAKAEKRK
jgi:putative spermidine/putrescine transport system permease protein